MHSRWIVGALVGALGLLALPQAGCGREDSPERAFQKARKASSPEDRIRWYAKAIDQAPDWIAAYKERGAVYMLMDRYDEAIRDFTTVIASEPECPLVFANRAIAYVRTGRYDACIADCDKAIALAPQYSGPYTVLAIAHVHKGQLSAAVADCTNSISLDPGDAGLYVSRSTINIRLGRLQEGIADCTRAIALGPDVESSAYMNRAAAYCKLKEYDKAWSDVRMCRKTGGSPPAELIELLVRESGRSE